MQPMDMCIGYKYILGGGVESDVTTGLCSRVVLDLVEGLEQDGLHLFTDNYYTSPQLAQALYKKGITLVVLSILIGKGFLKIW